MSIWQRSNRFDPAVARLADEHYSRQTIGSRQFTPPGQPIVLYIPGPQWPFKAGAGFVWWRPHPEKARRYDGYDGWWECTLFRNTLPLKSSELIKEALVWADAEWGKPPFGYDTYVKPSALPGIKVRGEKVFGWCFRKAGWIDKGQWTKDGKKLRLFLEAPASVSLPLGRM
jgi:hypothetical protein